MPGASGPSGMTPFKNLNLQNLTLQKTFKRQRISLEFAVFVHLYLEALVWKPLQRKLRKVLRKADLTRPKNGHVRRKLIDVSRKLCVRFLGAPRTPARRYKEPCE